MIRKIFTQHADRVLSEVIEIQKKVSLRHDGQPVRHAWGLLHMFNNIFSPVQCCHVGPAPEIVVGDMDFMAREHVAHMYHAGPGVRGVGTVREPRQQLGELRERFLDVGNIPLGVVRRDE